MTFMTFEPQVKPELLQKDAEDDRPANLEKPNADKILCPHCLRTATNGIKCQGICVADSDY